MKIKKTKISDTESAINILLEKKDYIENFENKIKELKRKANLKGFRPGMVPIQLLKNMYGKGVLFEELNKIISEKLNSYIKEEKIKIIGEPIPQKSDLDDIKINEINDFNFDFKVGHLSEFKIKPFKKSQKYTLNQIKVDKKIIDETIQNLKVQYADVNNLNKVTEKSSVYCEIITDEKLKKGLIDFKNLDKSESKKIIGRKVGDSIKINLIKLSKNNKEILSQILGEPVEIKDCKESYVLKIENIIERTPAKLAPTFYDKIFGPGKVKTTKEFQSEIKKSIEFNYMKESEYLLNKNIEDDLLKNHKIDVPKSYVESWIKQNNDEKTASSLLKEDFENYCNQIKWSYIVDDIIDKNKINIDNKEIEEMAKYQIQQQLQSSGMQNMSKDIDKFVENYLKHNKGENYLKIFNQLKSNKVFNLIKEKVSITKKSITFDKFKLMAKNIK